MKSKSTGILIMLSGAVLSTLAIFLTTVPHTIFAFIGRLLIVIGMLILFAVIEEK